MIACLRLRWKLYHMTNHCGLIIKSLQSSVSDLAVSLSLFMFAINVNLV